MTRLLTIYLYVDAPTVITAMTIGTLLMKKQIPGGVLWYRPVCPTPWTSHSFINRVNYTWRVSAASEKARLWSSPSRNHRKGWSRFTLLGPVECRAWAVREDQKEARRPDGPRVTGKTSPEISCVLIWDLHNFRSQKRELMAGSQISSELSGHELWGCPVAPGKLGILKWLS